MLEGSETSDAVDRGTLSFNDRGKREKTRIVAIFGINGTVRGTDGAGRPLSSAYTFGRFATHITAADSLFPQIVFDQKVTGQSLNVMGTEIPDLRILLFADPRDNGVLVIDATLADASAREVSLLLATTCFGRRGLEVDGVPILTWASRSAGCGSALEFGREVHQLVFPGGHLRGRLITEEPAVRGDGHGTIEQSRETVQIIYRGTYVSQENAPSVHRPPTLNAPGATLVKHGRGVSIMAGWSEPVENTFAVSAIGTISALTVLHRTRFDAFRVMKLDQSASTRSIHEARTLISSLSRQLNELQLDLSFGVEVHVDSILIPEIVIDSFQSSLRSAVGIHEGLANTTRMLERLRSVIQAHLSVLQTAVQERDEHRNRILTTTVAFATLIAVPPTLLLAYFGINSPEVDERWSIFDMTHYWPAYLLAWVPFIALFAMAMIRRRAMHPDKIVSTGEEIRVAARGTEKVR